MSLLKVIRRQFQRPPLRGLRNIPRRNLPISQGIGERRLDVVILGAPNAGKSVLLNNVIASKVAAISRKRHTTRGEILGVSNHRNVQLAFYDTPGYVYGQDAQSHEMKVLRSLALDAAKKADVALLVADAAIHHMHERQQDAFAEMVKIAFFNAKTEVILVLNKVDLVEPKTRLLETTRQLVSLINGIKLGKEQSHLAQLDTTTFMISALLDDGVIDLKKYLISLAKRKPWIIQSPKFVSEEMRNTLKGKEKEEEDDDDDEEEEEERERDENVIATPMKRAGDAGEKNHPPSNDNSSYSHDNDIHRHTGPSSASSGPTGPPFPPAYHLPVHLDEYESSVSDLDIDQRVEEIVLENVLNNVHEEIPYIVDIESQGVHYVNDKRQAIHIDVDIWVDTSQQQRILVGKKGRTMLAIRDKSCDTLQTIFNKRVFLMLHVKKRMKGGKQKDPQDLQYGMSTVKVNNEG